MNKTRTAKRGGPPTLLFEIKSCFNEVVRSDGFLPYARNIVAALYTWAALPSIGFSYWRRKRVNRLKLKLRKQILMAPPSLVTGFDWSASSIVRYRHKWQVGMNICSYKHLLILSICPSISVWFPTPVNPFHATWHHSLWWMYVYEDLF
jgi:hypothetical protein